jgi:hypothetical protein
VTIARESGAVAIVSGQITLQSTLPVPSIRAFAPTMLERSCTPAETRALGCTNEPDS